MVVDLAAAWRSLCRIHTEAITKAGFVGANDVPGGILDAHSGVVTSQTPRAGSDAQSGSVVHLKVTKVQD